MTDAAPIHDDGKPSAAPVPVGIRPIQAFEDNIRPARLMLKVYRLLDSRDAIQTDGDFVQKLRVLIAASATEELMVVQNEIFLGLVRERAALPKGDLKTATLCHLLRQAIVASCTALDAYLPAVLRWHLPTVIRAKGRDFIPRDNQVLDFFADLAFSLDEVLRLMSDEEAPLYISNKLLGLAKFKYLSNKKGIHVVGALLDVPKPWDMVALRLSRDKKELMKALEDTADRRNDIVHRADRHQKDPDGEQQAMFLSMATQGVDAISHVCQALDELLEARMIELRAAHRGP